MKRVTESIWSNKKHIIPMAEISHLEIENSGNNRGLWVIFKHSKLNPLSKFTMKLEPAIWLDGEDKESIKKDWCNYRSELEGVAYDPHSLDIAADNLKGFFNDIQSICNEYKSNTGG